jgi:hypothetical protein
LLERRSIAEDALGHPPFLNDEQPLFDPGAGGASDPPFVPLGTVTGGTHMSVKKAVASRYSARIVLAATPTSLVRTNQVRLSGSTELPKSRLIK